MRDTPIPATMRALLLEGYSGVQALRLAEIPVPRPRPGEILVRVKASPVNPSDVMFCRGQYGVTRPLPTTPGFEGCGVVVSAGSGWIGQRMVGKRVACGGQTGEGMWAEYAVMQATSCLPLPANITDEQGACALVNPVSAWVLIRRARREGHRALVVTAGASQLAQMLLRLGKKEDLPIIHVVHRAELIKVLKQMGAEHVLDSSTEEFDVDLKALADRLGATCALDAVGGDMTRRVLAALPSGKVVVYGALSGESCRADPFDLIFRSKRIEGFWLSDWLRTQHPIRLLWMLRSIPEMLRTELSTTVATRLSLEQATTDLALCHSAASKGKVLLTP